MIPPIAMTPAMDALWLGLRLLLLLTLANFSPIVARRYLRERWAAPLDGGLRCRDGRPLLGPSKTWRGLIVAVAVSALGAPLLGFPWQAGALAGAAAMSGDALASFIKRRRGLASSARAFVLDQLPESLLPLWALQPPLQLPISQVLGVCLAFVLLEPPVAKLAHRWGWREQPY